MIFPDDVWNYIKSFAESEYAIEILQMKFWFPFLFINWYNWYTPSHYELQEKLKVNTKEIIKANHESILGFQIPLYIFLKSSRWWVEYKNKIIDNEVYITFDREHLIKHFRNFHYCHVAKLNKEENFSEDFADDEQISILGLFRKSKRNQNIIKT
jgi:hypothetical protein